MHVDTAPVSQERIGHTVLVRTRQKACHLFFFSFIQIRHGNKFESPTFCCSKMNLKMKAQHTLKDASAVLLYVTYYVKTIVKLSPFL